MRLFNFFSKTSRPWQVHFFKPEGSRALSPEDILALSQPQDRPGAMAVIGNLWKEGAKLDRVTYDGKPISRTQLEDLVCDAHVLLSFLLSAGGQGVSIETFALDKARSKAAFTEAIRQTAKSLAVTEDHASDILLRRLPVGVAGIAKQQMSCLS